MTVNKKFTFCACLIWFISISSTAFCAPKWQIDNSQSKVEFIASQDSSMINGSFKNFSGEILFDEKKLQESKIKMEIDLDSISMSFAEGIATAKSKEWFDVKSFPKAIFVSNKISKVAENKFHVDGKLTLKQNSLPVSFEFKFEELSQNKAKAVGTIDINRSSFHVGDADEKKANGIKNLVIVKFTIFAKK